MLLLLAFPLTTAAQYDNGPFPALPTGYYYYEVQEQEFANWNGSSNTPTNIVMDVGDSSISIQATAQRSGYWCAVQANFTFSRPQGVDIVGMAVRKVTNSGITGRMRMFETVNEINPMQDLMLWYKSTESSLGSMSGWDAKRSVSNTGYNNYNVFGDRIYFECPRPFTWEWDSMRFVIKGTAPTATPTPSPTPSPTATPAYLLDRMVWNAAPECPVCDAQQAVGHVGGPINSRNGNLSYQETDLSIPVIGGELAFRRSYASGATAFYTKTMGSGWTHNYDMRLHFTNTALTDTVEFQASGGSRFPFYCSATDCTGSGLSFTPYPGVTASLSRITATNPITSHYVLTGFNQMAYTFNHQGLLLEQADPSGNVITFTHNSSAQLTRAAQGSRTLDYTYDGNGRLTEVEDQTGRAVALAYDANSDLVNTTLIGVNDSLVLTSTYEYSGTTHLLTKVTDPSGTVVEETTYLRDGDEYRAFQQKDALGNILAAIDYAITNTHVVTENGVVMTHTYDSRGTLVDTTFSCSDGTSGCGQGTDKSYDDNFKTSQVVDANSNDLDLSWNAGGSNLEEVTDAQNNQTALDYDAFNNLAQVTNARGYSTTYGYGNTNLPTFRTTMTDTLGNATVYTPTLKATDGISGLLQAERDPNGNRTTYDYNTFGQVTQVVRADGTTDAITTTYGYDGLGRLITTTQASAAESHTNLNVYDDDDRLIATIANWSGSDPAGWQQDCAFTGGARDSGVCTRYLYDGAGRTISTTNPLGQTSLTFYDAAGRVVTSVVNYDGTTAYNQLCASFSEPDPEYNICSLTDYDSYGRVSSTTDSLGRVSRTFYDSLGRVAGNIGNSVSVTSLPNCSFPPSTADRDLCTLYEYDAAGNTIVITDATGLETRTFYDELNRVAGTVENWTGSITDTTQLSSCLSLPAERDEDICTLYAYDEVGNTIVVTDTLGRMTRTFYDGLNRVEATVQDWNPTTLPTPASCTLSADNDAEENICTLYGYDPAGNQISATNALSQTTLTVYDAANRPAITVANWDGSTINDVSDCQFPPAVADVNLCTVATYDSLGRRVSNKDPLGNLTQFAYDGLGRVITTTRSLDGQPVESAITYDALGNRLSQTDAADNTATYNYDSLNRLVSTISAEGVVVTQTYDAAGQVITTTNGLGNSTTNGYDGRGRLVATVDPLGNSTQYAYDALGNQVAMVDAEGITTTYQYDDLNRLVGVVENDTGGASSSDSNLLTQYRYDALGNRTVITNALGYTSTLTVYDDLNRPISVADALANETLYRYDALGSRTVITDANGAISVLDLDGLNRLTSTQYLGDTETITFTYDAAGNRLAMVDALGTTNYYYDDLYRLITVTNPFTGTVAYGYDLVGNRTGLTYPDGKVVTYTYDSDNRLVQVEDWNSDFTSYDYDAAGRLITTTLPNGVVTTYAYDAADRLTALIHRGSSGELLASYLYTLDKMGNRVAVTETLRSPDSGEMAMLPGGLTAEEVLVEVVGEQQVGSARWLLASKPLLSAPAVEDAFAAWRMPGDAFLTAHQFKDLVAERSIGVASQVSSAGTVAELEIYLARTTLTADGRDGTRLIVLAKDANGRLADDGTLITLQAIGGQLSATEVRTADGLAQAWLRASERAGVGQVTAATGDVSSQVSFELVAPPARTVRLDEAEPEGDGELPFDLAEIVERSRNTIQVDPDGQTHVDRPGHQAVFDAGQLHFTAKGESEEETSESLSFELSSITLGELQLFERPAPAALQLENNVARIQRGPGLVEEFIARDGGIEQRWRIDRDPGVDGNLVISVDVETSLLLDMPPSDEGFTFWSAGSRTERPLPAAFYRRAVAIDALGRSKLAELRGTYVETVDGSHHYRLQMMIPAGWLARAEYPLLIDPLIGSLLQLDASAKTSVQKDPAVASNTDDEDFLVVWSETTSGSSDTVLYGQRFALDGSAIGENFNIATVANQGSVELKHDVAFNVDDGSYLVVWTVDDDSISGQILDYAGSKVGDSFVVYSATTYSLDSLAVSYSPTASAWLVSWSESLPVQPPILYKSSVKARAVEGNGNLKDSFSVAGATTESRFLHADVAANEVGDFLIVWQRASAIHARRVVTTTGQGGSFTVTVNSSNALPNVTYNPDDEEYLVVWENYSGDDSIWGRQVQAISGTNQFVDDPFEIGSQVNVDNNRPAATYFSPVGAGNGVYLVAWQQTDGSGNLDLKAQRVAADTTFVGSVITLTNATGDQEDVSLGFGPTLTTTLSAWLDAREGADDVYARLVDMDGTLGDEFRVHPATRRFPATGDQQLPKVAYNQDDDEYLIVWEDYRNTDGDIYGQRVSGSGSLIGDNITFTLSTDEQASPQVAYGDGVFLVVWQDQTGDSANIHGRVVSPTGELAEGGVLTVTSATNAQQPTDLVFNSDLDKFLVLWQDQRSNKWNVWARHVTAAGTMGSEIQVTSSSKAEENPAGTYNPDDDQYLISWEYKPSGGSNLDIIGRRMTGGESVYSGDSIQIATGSNVQTAPEVIYLSGAGRYVVAWHEDSSGYDVYGRLVKPDGTTDGNAYTIASESQDEQYPQMALDGSSGAMVTWQRDNGGSAVNDLYGRQLNSSGQPTGSALTFVDDDDEQQRPAIAGNGAGEYFLAWQDDRNGNWDLFGAPILHLTADFTAQPTSGNAPLVVQFTDASTPSGAADEWLWSFGDSGSSVQQSPVYTYTSTGNYTVTLTITDTASGETDAVTKTNFITVTQPAASELVTTTITYAYDPLYRLTGATYTGDLSATYGYVYDAVGNMTVFTETISSTKVVTRTFNGANQLVVSGDGSGVTSYTYDGNGNLVESSPPDNNGGKRYGYNQRNLLITGTVYVSGTGWVQLVDYSYDGAGDRLRQVDYSGALPITTTYTNDIFGLTQVLVADDGTVQVANLFGLDLVLQDTGTVTRTLLTDGLGSVRTEMVDDSVETVTTFSPYGQVLDQQGDSETVYGFTGEQYDDAVGLLYLRARYYSPYIYQRFLTPDPIVPDFTKPQNLNLYTYALNNPAINTDPSGYCIPRENGSDCYHESRQNGVHLSSLIDFGGISGEQWVSSEKVQVDRAARQVGRRIAETYNNYMYGFRLSPYLSDNEYYLFNCGEDKHPLTSREAFLYFYGGPVLFYKTGTTNGTAYGKFEYIAPPVNRVGIKVYTAAVIDSPSAGYRWATHELGHYFEARINAIKGWRHVRGILASYASEDLPLGERIPRRGADNYDRSYGFAGPRYGWQQSPEPTAGEEFADMFIGWNYNQWAPITDQDFQIGQTRSDFMNRYMPSWIALVINQEKRNTR